MEKPVRPSFQYLSISYECSLAIGNSLNLSEMLHEVIHTVVHKTNAHRGIIWVKNEKQELQPVANAGINIEDVLAQSERMDLLDVLDQIQKKQQFVLKYKDDNDFLQYCPVLSGKEESVLIVPVNNVAILYLVYASLEIADDPLANLLSSLSKKLSVAIEACMAHENIIKEIQVREKAEKELTKKTEQLISREKELQGLYGESEQARKSLLSILEDVMQKEEALRLSETKFKRLHSMLRLMCDNLPELIWTKDLDNKFMFANKACCNDLLNARDTDEPIGKTDIYFSVREQQSHPEIPNYHTFGETCVFSDEVVLKSRKATRREESGNIKGKYVVLDILKAPYFNEDGKMIGTVGCAKDITERKKADIALQESEHRLLRAQEVAHVGDWEYDVKTGVSIWSDEIYKIYGFDPADDIESEIMLTGMHPDDLDHVNVKFEDWIKDGYGEPFEYRIVRPDGSIRHVYSPAEVVCDSNDNVVKVYGTALDITDQKNAEESLKIYAEKLVRSNEELKSLDIMKNDFLSNVSHELRTPLVSIKGFSEVVQNELYGPLNDQQKKAIDIVIRNSERLGRLIDSILYLTVKKAGKDTYTFVSVNMSVIIGNAIIDLSPQANSKELTIEQDIAPDLSLINGDMDKLTQVLINLIENATKFTPNGGKITVKAYNEDENVHITVSDTGIGISNEVISNLFDKFYQVDASTTRRYGGTGIGLYISKLIIKVHKGRIWGESKQGVGTTFHVVLPM